MKFGFVVPFANAREFTEVAVLGEQHGWDAVFTWEPVWGVDAWVTLGAAAMVTERIRLGTLLTPVPRWKPWDLASRVATVDRLSGGRVILSCGLGAVHEGWTAFERDEGRRIRVQKLDEGLAVFAGLLAGQPFEYHGKHYDVTPTDHLPPEPPVQLPHPPVWVVGAYVRGQSDQPSLDRAARWEGLLPQVLSGEDKRKSDTIEVFGEVVALLRTRRSAMGLAEQPFDFVIEADSTGEFVQLSPPDPTAWAEAGATWWVESWWSLQPGREGLAEVKRRVSAGPPA
ncbi:MAG: LLM class flavin-dependent oxidoreductase [Acidimicrobiales bacterium]